MMKPGDHRQNVSMEKLRPGRRGASRVLFLFPSNELQHPVGKTARFLAGAAPAPTTSAANRLIGEVVQSRRRPLLGPSPG